MPVIFGLLAVTLGLIGLAFTIPRVVRLARTAPLLRVPVVAEHSPMLPIAIVGIVLSGALTIGGIVLTAFSFADVPVDPDTVAVSSLPDAPASAGRQLRSDRAVVAAWREVRWPPAHLSLEVPADWAERRNDAAQLDLRPADLQTTFVTVRLSPAPELAVDDFLRVARLQGASRFAASRVAGYAVKTLGAASGVLSFERSKESTKEQLSWTSIVPGSKQMITISLGAATEKFAQAEPVLGAILDSIRIGGLPPLEKGE